MGSNPTRPTISHSGTTLLAVARLGSERGMVGRSSRMFKSCRLDHTPLNINICSRSSDGRAPVCHAGGHGSGPAESAKGAVRSPVTATTPKARQTKQRHGQRSAPRPQPRNRTPHSRTPERLKNATATMVAVAQPGRTPDCGSGSSGIEARRPPQADLD